MIWLTWRQHRVSLLIMAAIFVVIAGLLVYQGWVLNAAYNQLTDGRSVAACERGGFNDSDCQQLEQNYISTYYDPPFEPLPAIVLPLVVGIFLGAPLVARELESGTFRLVWTQSVTRKRWLLTKVGAQLTIALLAFGILVPATIYSLGPLYGGPGNLNPLVFDVEGFVPLAYLAFAFGLALAAGAILRTTLPAMFASIVGYCAVRYGVETYLRQHFLTPITSIWDPSTAGPGSVGNGWTIDVGMVDVSGRQWFASRGSGQLPCNGPGTDQSTIQCMHSAGLMDLRIWQPADRFWAFQTIESALFAVLAIALVALTVWWLRHRVP